MALFETEKFISQIKKRPAIYDINCLQYNDRTAKTNAWFEVCQEMVDGWDTLTDEDRAFEERALRNKWRNIRDYFMKEVKLLNAKKGRGGKRRKKSAYYSHLQFLLPMSAKKRGSNKSKGAAAAAVAAAASRVIEPLKDEILITDDIEIVETPEIEEYSLTGVSLRGNGSTDDPYQQQHQAGGCEASMASFDNEMPVDVLSGGPGGQRTFQSGDDDYDKMFLLSLLPSLRQIPEHMKLHVRIQMQQILASAFHTSNHHAG